MAFANYYEILYTLPLQRVLPALKAQLHLFFSLSATLQSCTVINPILLSHFKHCEKGIKGNGMRNNCLKGIPGHHPNARFSTKNLWDHLCSLFPVWLTTLCPAPHFENPLENSHFNIMHFNVSSVKGWWCSSGLRLLIFAFIYSQCSLYTGILLSMQSFQ